jgi:transcription termination factor NusB
MSNVNRKYYLNLLVRRSAVQAVYQQICAPSDNLIEEVKQEDHFLQELKLDQEVLEKTLSGVLNMWDSFEEVVTSHTKQELDLTKITRCGVAILRCAVAEILEKNIPILIIINEYLELSKIFCEKDVAFINKVLDYFVPEDIKRSSKKR